MGGVAERSPVVVPLSAVNGWGGCSGKARSSGGGAEGRDDYDRGREVEGWAGASGTGTAIALVLVLVLADEPAMTCLVPEQLFFVR
ncbi:Imm21 family immunity protein [Streptomyces sp. AM 3-1-1]|uniref:Imm21 family immunity protein n=1 Tax=Streptomyces sp. AM 3-1-1 TaxID=3028711 RepID=UPI0023B9BDCA|nr:Imm21 family immunity protein [Streptomyces sp. AM 3-1-1]WEH29449.1 Imm21 family immunity protein [Streptomyces sp. AM 3-1-1]